MLLDKLVEHDGFALQGQRRVEVLNGALPTNILCIALLNGRINFEELLLIRGHDSLMRHSQLLVLKLFFSLLCRSLGESRKISRFFTIGVTKLLLFTLRRVFFTRTVLFVLGKFGAAREA